MKISIAQLSVLFRMADRPDNWFSAYELKESLGTLKALRRKGYVLEKSEVNYLLDPRKNLLFQITHRGLAHVQTIRKGKSNVLQ